MSIHEKVSNLWDKDRLQRAFLAIFVEPKRRSIRTMIDIFYHVACSELRRDEQRKREA